VSAAVTVATASVVAGPAAGLGRARKRRKHEHSEKHEQHPSHHDLLQRLYRLETLPAFDVAVGRKIHAATASPAGRPVVRRARLPALSSPSDHKPGFLREQSRVLGRQVSARVVGNPLVARLITRYFHRLYYGMRARTWLDTHWLGTPLLKCPLDLWI